MIYKKRKNLIQTNREGKILNNLKYFQMEAV